MGKARRGSCSTRLLRHPQGRKVVGHGRNSRLDPTHQNVVCAVSQGTPPPVTPSCVRRRSRTGPIHHPNTILGSLCLGRIKGIMMIRDRAWSVPWDHKVEGAPPKHSSPFPRLLKGLTASPAGQDGLCEFQVTIKFSRLRNTHLCPLQTSIYLCRSSQTLQTVGTFHSH